MWRSRYSILFTENQKPLTIREISRKLGITPAGAKKIVDRLEKEGVLKTRTSGRNREVSVNYGSIKTVKYMQFSEIKHFLELPVLVREAFLEAVRSIKKKPLIASIFGSYARENYRKESDVDVLLVFNSKETIDLAYPLSPVVLSWDEFYTGYDRDPLLIHWKRNRIVPFGVEWLWVIENERIGD